MNNTHFNLKKGMYGDRVASEDITIYDSTGQNIYIFFTNTNNNNSQTNAIAIYIVYPYFNSKWISKGYILCVFILCSKKNRFDIQ